MNDIISVNLLSLIAVTRFTFVWIYLQYFITYHYDPKIKKNIIGKFRKLIILSDFENCNGYISLTLILINID